MRELTLQECEAVAGGDRWCDGQDQKNHPDESPSTLDVFNQTMGCFVWAVYDILTGADEFGEHGCDK
jgi:hypothetical protein